jgi:BASS family bile acid:Na+ symporter
MSDHINSSGRSLSDWVHQYLLGLLICAYVAAAVFPDAGLSLREVSFGEVVLFGQATTVTLPMLMLAFLLLCAGLGVRPARLRHLRRGVLTLFTGLAGNLFVPLAFVLAVAQGLRLWHNPVEAQQILVGLALVVSMPIAGSSTAWAQNADGDMALSLGLVLCSTLLSPLTTPAGLHAVGWTVAGDYAEHLRELATSGTGAFLAVCVVLPSLLGILTRGAVGEARVAAARPFVRLASTLDLLLLIYANTSVSLPEAVAYPDADFLALTAGIALTLYVLCFASGWWIARLLRTDPSRRAALMFGLGMNNNGTGLVLAAAALAEHPRVMLPLIFYNLVQHLVAGGVAFLLGRRPASQQLMPTGRGMEGLGAKV